MTEQPNISIRPVTSVAECDAIIDISKMAWGLGEMAVPNHLLITMARNQGVVLLAWDGDRPIGFCFSFVGFDGHPNSIDFRLKHCSHMAAVVPRLQKKGIGALLKWAQRKHVLAQGVRLMTWTFDPLESRNAKLNMHKLGAICHTYKEDAYGDTPDDLNAGLPTDRFEVEWHLDSPAVQARASGGWRATSAADYLEQGATFVNAIVQRDNLLHPHLTTPIDGQVAIHLMTIPRHFQAVKSADMPLALKWRLHTRTLFQQAFNNGYTAIDLLAGNLAIEPDQSIYVFAKNYEN